LDTRGTLIIEHPWLSVTDVLRQHMARLKAYGGQFAHGRWLEKNAERGIDACADAAKAGLDQRVSAGIGA